MAIMHIVLFEFTPVTSHQRVEKICADMVGLSTSCKHPKTQQPYLRSFGGGRDTSPEGLQGAFTHGFICEFANEEDRAYYLDHDPAHQAFKASISDALQNVRVIDYESGKF